MGMAASQARYLALTARKSNVEFQGQQINQQRTALAIEQSELFAELSKLKNPIPPSPLAYQYDVYTFDAKLKEATDTTSFRVKKDSIEKTEETVGQDPVYKMTAEWTEKDVYHSVDIKGTFTGSDPNYYNGLTITDGGNAIQEDYVTLKSGTWQDEEAFSEATEEYNYEIRQYNAEVDKINNKAEQIQLKDRTLELKLRNLDTEQNALQTELESVKKVIEDTIKNVFTTFQSS